MAKKILLIEDDPTLLETLAHKLKAVKFTVLTSTGAEEAFELMREEKPDLILTDLIMHDVDGFAILTILKADPALVNIPVIVLSNQGDPDDIKRAIELGAKDFIVKADNSLEEIVSKVTAFLEAAAD